MAPTISELKAAAEQAFIELWPSIPLLAFELSLDWGAQHPKYKDVLRDSLKSVITDLKFSTSNLILDQHAPRHSELSISISHSPTLGGFVITEKNVDIGFDVEERPRIKQKVLDRISSPEERSICPNGEYLWVAKESCFKGLVNNTQPQTMTQIVIQNWNKTNHYASFEAALKTGPNQTKKIRGSGVVIETSSFLVAFFVIPAST